IVFPEDYHAEELSGKEAVFQVKIHEIKEKEIPELDDEFAKDVDEEVESLDELKEKKKDELLKQKEQEIENNKRESLIKQVTENAEVDINEEKEKEIQEINDEFDKEMNEEVENLDELKEKKKDELLKQKEQEIENNKRESLIKQVTENAEVDIPEEMVDTELNQMMQEFEQRLQMQGMALDQYFQFSGQTEDELKEQMKEDAFMRVKTNLVLEAVLEKEELEVSEEDIDAELTEMASMYKMEKDQILGML